MTKAKKDAATLRQNFEDMRKNDDEYKYCESCWYNPQLEKDKPIWFHRCEHFCKKEHKSRASSIHHILAWRSWIHLKETFKIYKREYSIDFDADIYSDWEDYTEALLAIYQYAMNSNLFFAKALARDVYWCDQDSSWGYVYGVARVFVWRSEIDLGDIEEAFDAVYSTTLLGYVKKYISGDAKDALIGILH